MITDADKEFAMANKLDQWAKQRYKAPCEEAPKKFSVHFLENGTVRVGMILFQRSFDVVFDFRRWMGEENILGINGVKLANEQMEEENILTVGGFKLTNERWLFEYDFKLSPEQLLEKLSHSPAEQLASTSSETVERSASFGS